MVSYPRDKIAGHFRYYSERVKGKTGFEPVKEYLMPRTVQIETRFDFKHLSVVLPSQKKRDGLKKDFRFFTGLGL